MRYLMDIGAPIPPSFAAAAALVINANIRVALQHVPIEGEHLAEHLADAATWSVTLDEPGLAFAAKNTLEALAIEYEQNPDDIELLHSLEASAAGIKPLPFPVDLSEVQNRYWNVLQSRYPDYARRAARSEADALAWIESFRALGADLNVRVD